MSQTSTNPQASISAARGGKYLTFALGREEYGLPILRVREIIGYMDVTFVPCMPSHVKGVINLRGQVISVIDLRARFLMSPTPTTEQTCIIVVEIEENQRRVHCGVVVDRVSEVLSIASDSIEDAPNLGSSVMTDFIVGMAKVGSSVKILLNLDKVLAAADLVNPVSQATGRPIAANSQPDSIAA